MMVRVVILSSFPLDRIPFREFTVLFRRTSGEELRSDVEYVVANYHPDASKMLAELTKFEARPEDTYEFHEHDIIYVIKGQEIVKAIVVKGSWL